MYVIFAHRWTFVKQSLPLSARFRVVTLTAFLLSMFMALLLDFGRYGGTFYYSRTSMDLKGALVLSRQPTEVTGSAWFDHQWGNFQPQAIGWDWFALQLDDGSDLMLYFIRQPNGSAIVTEGSYIAKDETLTVLHAPDFSVSKAGATWKSPVSGITYPSGWEVKLPKYNLDLKLVPVFPASEFDARNSTTNLYWEGEVTASGSRGGRGFVELVGYRPV